MQGAACVLKLVKPIETALLSKHALTNDVLAEFLTIWKAALNPDLHWKFETERDNVIRHVGIGLAQVLFRYCETIKEKEVKELIEIINANRFSLGDKLSVFALMARRINLADVTGAYANMLSSEILKGDYIEQRGESYQDLAGSLIPMSIAEAKEYYAQGLAQLDQMGSNDFDLIYSALDYAAEQPAGFVKPEFSHRLMNLCQTIFQHEPSKFGWTLFGRAASSSIGFPAMYKLIRWYDQDVVDYSYSLPQLACFLAKEGHLDARRAAVLLTICEDHGWHEWQVGNGLHDLLSVANPEDRKAIFSLVAGKLDREHSLGGWEGLWESLLDCIDDFEEINEGDLRSHFQALREAARFRRDIENARNNHSETSADRDLQVHSKKLGEQATKDALAAVLAKCDLTSASSLDEAIQDIQASDGLRFDNRKRLFDEIQKTCPFEKRVKFLEALCESTELEFDSALDLIIECVTVWSDSTAHVKNSVRELIKKLFAFKGSEVFDLRYSGISRQIFRLSKFCDDPKFVLQTALETIAKERLELGGDEWLQIATSLSRHTDSVTSLNAFEDLLSSSAARVGDEIGEGVYRTAFAGKFDEVDVVADIIWHLLGDSNAFIRWSAARSLKNMLDVGLIEDVRVLLDRFDLVENPSLSSDKHHFAFLNAQQWLLMGLARAALYHGEKLKPLKPQIAALAKRTDLHVINKLHLARCLRYIEGEKSMSPELAKLWTAIRMPPHGIIERDGWPENKDRRIDFGFDYDFKKNKISSLARLFWISDNEASDCIADEVIKRWPDSKSMSDFPGGVRYRGDERIETYRGHIQKHALLHAATTFMQSKPVTRSSYDWNERNPWQEFLRDEDVSFENGSWLSDYKDRVPAQALEYLLGKRKGSQETLMDREMLFQRIGFPENIEYHFLPLYGYWTSLDGVSVRFVSALINHQGAVLQCKDFSKSSDHDFWLPMFDSGGRVNRYSKKRSFDPLIWEPEKYPIGIDEHDEQATRAAIARPRLGLSLNKKLRLTPDEYYRQWHDDSGMFALESQVWGEWKPDLDVHRGRFQDEGAILWAERKWLDGVLKSCNQSLIFMLSFSKYKSSKSYDESSGVRKLYVGMKRIEELPRFWFAKKASKTVY